MSKINTIKVHRLDYKNPEGSAYKILDTLDTIEGVDINEIKIIYVGDYHDKAMAEEVAALFPKSYGGKVSTTYGGPNGVYHSVRFCFNTFWANKSTGAKNETAIANRVKVIKKLKELMKG